MQLILILLWALKVPAFLTPPSSSHLLVSSQKQARTVLFYNKGEKEEDALSETHRMELVRQLQDLFYRDETNGVDHDHFGVYDNMPILKSQRVELPGFQSLWNITDPLEIHMFLKVIHTPDPRLFGHLHSGYDYGYHLQDYEDEATVTAEPQDKYNVGTLMTVTDWRQNPNTGHLIVLVQALARFVVVGSTERWDWMSLDHQHINNADRTVVRASVELLPDTEFVDHFRKRAKQTAKSYDFSRNQDTTGAACAGAIAEAAQWRFFESLPQRIPVRGQNLDPVASLSPKPFTAITKDTQMAMEEYLSQSPTEVFQGECRLYPDDSDGVDDGDDDGADPFFFGRRTEEDHMNEVMEVERSVWLELDKLTKNLSQLNPKSNTEMPIPNQILCLLPYPMYWPNDFTLAKYARQLARAHAVLSRNKYKQDNGFQLVPKDYPPLRRARRLSYILWNVFLEQDTMDVPSGEMQRVLEINSISARLQAGHLQLQTINRILRTLIEN